MRSRSFQDLVTEIHRRAGEQLDPRSVCPGVLSAVGDAMVVLDCDLRVIAANRGSCDLFRVPEQSAALGRSILEFLPRTSLPALNSILSQLLAGGHPVVELTANRGDGHEVTLEVRAAISPDSAGAIGGFIVILHDVTRRKAAEEPLGLILEGTSRATGDAFFRSLVEYLAKALGMRHALVGKLVGLRADRIQTLAVWSDGRAVPNVNYELEGSPCERAVARRVSVHPVAVQAAYPADELLVTMSAECYVGATLIDSTGHPIGVLAVIDSRPLERSSHVQAIVELFAARAAAELERLRVEHALRTSQERLNTAVSGTSDGLFDIDVQTDAAYVSPRYAELLGFRDDAFAVPTTGAALLALVHPDDLALSWSLPHSAQWSERVTNQPFRIRHRTGEYRWFECRSTLLRDPAGRPTRHLGFVRDVTETLRLERLLSHTNRIARVGGWEYDPVTGELSWTDEVHRIFGTDAAEFRPSIAGVRRCFDDRTWADLAATFAIEDPAVATREMTVPITTIAGESAWIRILLSAEHRLGKVSRWFGAIQDVTAFRQLEEQLIVAQKMEGIGRLAGGVAHDFNNLLTAILGACEVAADAIPPTSEALIELAEIRRAAVSASMLTRQLLAFARKDITAPKAIRLDRLVAKVEGLLTRVIGEDIDLIVDDTPLSWPVFADPGQIEQVIVNLVVNARDAMPEGGRLTIETALAPAGTVPNLAPGDFVLLKVTDTGVGMSPATQARIFEPFFTTKQPGQGTGLGLATCHGIVAQAGGTIRVRSTPGSGTTFEIYLPRHLGQIEAQIPLPAAPGRGRETVLIVEDEPGVRRVSRIALERLGYRVLEASNGGEALALLDHHRGSPPHLLLTDVVLPGPSGPETARVLVGRLPNLKVLYMTGYAGDSLLGKRGEQTGVLHKPFTLDELGRRVREVLDGRAA